MPAPILSDGPSDGRRAPLLAPIPAADIAAACAMADRLAAALHADIQPYAVVKPIQRACAAYFGVTLADLTSARRARHLILPRHVAMYLAKELTPLSLPEIGRRFGNRDHTTVMHAMRKIAALRLTDMRIDAAVRVIADAIEAATGARIDAVPEMPPPRGRAACPAPDGPAGAAGGAHA